MRSVPALASILHAHTVPYIHTPRMTPGHTYFLTMPVAPMTQSPFQSNAPLMVNDRSIVSGSAPKQTYRAYTRSRRPSRSGTQAPKDRNYAVLSSSPNWDWSRLRVESTGPDGLARQRASSLMLSTRRNVQIV